MAALIAENDAPQQAHVSSDALTQGLYGGSGTPGGADASNFSSTGEMIKGRMPELVKGAGMAPKGGNMPLSDHTDILRRASQASLDLRLSTRQGVTSKSSVVKSMNPDFLKQFGALQTALTMPSIGEQLASFLGQVASPDIVRSFTAGNLGIGTTYGLTPFNLLAPSRLIYPVYTVYRNKFARPPGQGASLIERLAVGITGSQTGGIGVSDVSIPELVTTGGSFGNWPLNLPPAASEQFVTLNVP